MNIVNLIILSHKNMILLTDFILLYLCYYFHAFSLKWSLAQYFPFPKDPEIELVFN